jgi:hypothetical protein
MEIFFIVHLILMPLGFLLLAGAVITVRYLRKKMWWFRLHKMLGVLATVFFIAGGVAAVLMVSLSGRSHFSVPHTWLGAGTICLMVSTLTVGFLQTRVSNKKRMRMVHRIAGRTMAGLSLVAVVTGAIAAGIIPVP